MERYDVAIIGLGAMGSAAAAHCAKRGARTIGFEQFELGHEFGSSAGATRIIRKAYFEDVAYVPLLERAYDLWHSLEDKTQCTLLDLCGVLVIDRADGDTARGVLRASREHGIAVDTLSAEEARRRYPQFRIGDDQVAILEPDAGVVFAERGIRAHLDLAQANGARLQEHARVERWERHGDALRLVLEDGTTVLASRIIVTAGAWLPVIFSRAGLPLTVQRNVQYWFEPRGTGFGRNALPAFFVERTGLPAPMYGMPDLGNGVKVALHGYGETTTAETLVRDVGAHEIDDMRRFLEMVLPNAAGALRATKSCMYTMTPDGHFAIGRDPSDDRTIVAGGFSGHGYKFAPVIGEILTHLALDGGTPHDIAFLDLRRLLKS